MEIIENKNNVLITKEKKQVSEKITIIKFYSYNTHIASYEVEYNKLILNSNMWNHSQTTTKQFKQFVNNYTSFIYTTKKEFEKTILNNNDIIIL